MTRTLTVPSGVGNFGWVALVQVAEALLGVSKAEPIHNDGPITRLIGPFSFLRRDRQV